MTLKTFTTFSFLLALLNFARLDAQSVKKQIKEAKAQFEQGNAAGSSEIIEAVLKLEPQNTDALMIQGAIAVKQSKWQEAESSFRSVVKVEPKNDKALLALAGACKENKKFSEAISITDQLIALKSKDASLWIFKAKLQIDNKQFDQVINTSRKAIELDDENPEPLMLQAIAADSLNNSQVAEKYYDEFIRFCRSIETCKARNDLLAQAHAGIAKAQMALYKFDLAIYNYAEAISRYPQNQDYIIGRAKSFAENKELQRALEDYKKVLSLNSSNFEALYRRALIYKQLAQFDLAASDLGNAIYQKPQNAELYALRCACFTSAKDFNSALRDAKKAKELEPQNAEYSKLLAVTSELHYEANKEEIEPTIRIAQPRPLKDTIWLRSGLNVLELQGMVMDASTIKSLLINGASVYVNENQLNPEFSHTLNLDKAREINIQATDIYLNTANWVCKIIRTETVAPVVAIGYPAEGKNNEIIFDSDDYRMGGTVSDESQIQSIRINGVSVVFDNDKINPTFEHTLGQLPIDSVISIETTDILGNVSLKKVKYLIIDSTTSRYQQRTWIITIENANYVNLSRSDTNTAFINDLEANAKEYNIHRIKRFKNLSRNDFKSQFEAFLQNEVDRLAVSSLVILYDGLAVSKEGKGYLIPVEGDTNKLATLYPIKNITEVVAQNPKILHSLIINAGGSVGSTDIVPITGNVKNIDCQSAGANLASGQMIYNPAGNTSAGRMIFLQALVNSFNNKGNCVTSESIFKTVSKALELNKLSPAQIALLHSINNQQGSFTVKRR
jgi:tetratricopeptide (TPR) repeat protein